MSPFEQYPGQGRTLIGRVPIAETRGDMARNFQRLTGITRCACCSTDFSEDLERWLTMQLESVVPLPLCRKLGLPAEWADDASNRMLLCAACEILGRSVQPDNGYEPPATFEAFLAIRDAVFAQRRSSVEARRRAEAEFHRTLHGHRLECAA
jgi:hypothetical protein